MLTEKNKVIIKGGEDNEIRENPKDNTNNERSSRVFRNILSVNKSISKKI